MLITNYRKLFYLSLNIYHLLHILKNEDREIVQYGNFFIRLHVLHHQVAEYNQLTDVGFIYLLA